MTQPTGEHLEPCPFCGGNNVVLYSPVMSDRWAVHCEDCEIKGPTSYASDRAAVLWNKRP